MPAMGCLRKGLHDIVQAITLILFPLFLYDINHVINSQLNLNKTLEVCSQHSTCFRSSSAALLDVIPQAEPRLLAMACCSLASSRASALSLRSLSRGGGGGGGGGSGGAGASLLLVPAFGLGLSLVPALLLLKTGREPNRKYCKRL